MIFFSEPYQHFFQSGKKPITRLGKTIQSHIQQSAPHPVTSGEVVALAELVSLALSSCPGSHPAPHLPLYDPPTGGSLCRDGRTTERPQRLVGCFPFLDGPWRPRVKVKKNLAKHLKIWI